MNLKLSTCEDLFVGNMKQLCHGYNSRMLFGSNSAKLPAASLTLAEFSTESQHRRCGKEHQLLQLKFLQDFYIKMCKRWFSLFKRTCRDHWRNESNCRSIAKQTVYFQRLGTAKGQVCLYETKDAIVRLDCIVQSLSGTCISSHLVPIIFSFIAVSIIHVASFPFREPSF